MRTLTPELHKLFVREARKISPPFAKTLEAIGPIGFQGRRTRDFATHLARIVVGQQLSTLAAKSIWARVESAAAHLPRTLDLFVESNETILRGCGLSGAKTRAPLGLREADAAGQLDARKLAKLSREARQAALVNLRGIGPWTADMVSMFYFHEPDIWPLGDLAVRKTFERFVSAHAHHDVHTGAERFAPYRSFLALYMWRIANNGPDE